jgi:hypothetical protein
MWKSFCVAAGIFACILGAELLIIDSAVIVPVQGGAPETFTAPDWAPWALLSVGAATIMHFVALPARGSSGQPPYHGR